MVLPHKLLPWMVEHDLFPTEAMDPARLREYWEHLSGHLEWAKSHVALCHHAHVPVWLWGDDAQYNELGQKIVAVSMGCVLDDRTHCVQTVWPLFAYRFDTCLILFLIIVDV